jgi:hypothetical protein
VTFRGRRSAGARWLRRLALAVLVVEALYLLAGNLFLHTAWGRGVLRGGAFSATWTSAWTPLPGLVRFEALELRGGRRVRWRVGIDRGRAWFWLPALARREVRVVGGRVAGVEVEVDPRSEGPPEWRRGRSRPGWRTTLGSLRVAGLRRVRVAGYEIAGNGLLRGGASFQARGPMQLHLARLGLDGGVVRSAGTEIARGVRLEASVDSRPFHVGRQDLTELLAGLDGELELEADTDNVGFVAAYLRRVPWLGLDGTGHLAVDAVLAAGVLRPGSTFVLTGEHLRADFFALTAHGGGRLEGRVDDGGGLRLGAVLAELTLERPRDGATILTGSGLEAWARTPTAAVHEAPAGLSGRVSLPSARSADLAVLGAYLPPGLGLRFAGGNAELAAELEFDTLAGTGRGRLTLEAREMTGGFGDAAFAGDLTLRAKSPDLDLLAGRFDLSGTRLDVEDGRFERGGRVRSSGWWGRVEVPAGRVTLARSAGGPAAAPPAMAITAELDAHLLDTAPVVVLLEQRLPKLAWFDRLLTVPDVTLTGRLSAQGSELGLYGVEVTGGEEDRLEIRADLDVDGPATTGAAYVRYRALDASLDLDRGDRDWGLRRARQRYEASAARRAALRTDDD